MSQLPPPPPPPGYYGQPSSYGWYQVPDAPNATAAMVLGIISLCVLPIGCCCWLGSLVSVGLGITGIVLGVGARNRIAASQGGLGGGGKALAGIITGGIATGLAALFLVLGLALFGLGSSGVLNNLIPSPTPSG
jgi:hypothetical protein